MPPSLHRVLSGQFPGFTSTAGRSDCLPPFPPHFVAFAWRYRSVRSCFAPATAERSHRRPGALDQPAAPRAGHRAETAGPPRFLENPSVLMPCSSTPVGPPRQACSTLRCCLPWLLQRRLPRLPPSGLNHTACSLAVYASSPRSLVTTQDSLPTAGQALPGGTAYPLGSLAGFQSRLHLILPAQASPGAQ